MKILYVFGGIPLYANAMLNRLVEKNAEIVAVIPARRSKVLGKGVKVIDERQAAYKIINSRERKHFSARIISPICRKSFKENSLTSLLPAGLTFCSSLSTAASARHSIKMAYGL